jgi:hypothetical protein
MLKRFFVVLRQFGFGSQRTVPQNERRASQSGYRVGPEFSTELGVKRSGHSIAI